VGTQIQSESRVMALHALEELAALAATAGADVVAEVFQHIRRVDPKYFIGSGKVGEIADLVQSKKADLVIFDHELSPSQLYSLNEALKIKIIDRTGLILDIFGARARSREGKLQVELAQLIYLLPRMKGGGVELSRLGGGIGTRGPGEMKREIEQRRARDRIAYLKRQIQSVKETRLLYRQKRQGVPVPVVAIVGYTNSGKSTLLNALTDSDVFVEDKLFSTLDPTTRELTLPHRQKALLTDTVGFIQKLPVQLVEAFKATLEEINEADLLLHVIDLSHPEFETHIQEVQKLLLSLGAEKKPVIHVYNKTDRVKDARTLFLEHRRLHPFVMISARERQNLEALREQISRGLTEFVETVHIKIPIDAQKLLALIYNQGHVLEKKFFKKYVRVTAQVPKKMAHWLKRYEIF